MLNLMEKNSTPTSIQSHATKRLTRKKRNEKKKASFVKVLNSRLFRPMGGKTESRAFFLLMK